MCLSYYIYLRIIGDQFLFIRILNIGYFCNDSGPDANYWGTHTQECLQNPRRRHHNRRYRPRVVVDYAAESVVDIAGRIVDSAARVVVDYAAHVVVDYAAHVVVDYAAAAAAADAAAASQMFCIFGINKSVRVPGAYCNFVIKWLFVTR